jgi:hypothetical protein
MISGSDGGEYDDGCLLGCSTVYTGISSPTFQRSVLPPSSGGNSLIALMMEAVQTSETVNLYQCTRGYIPKDSHLQKNKSEGILDDFQCCNFNDFVITFLEVTHSSHANHIFLAANSDADNFQALGNTKRSTNNVTERNAVSLPSTIAFCGRRLKNCCLSFTGFYVKRS